ncbi:MAG: B12-binding domain-containing radical SAM protein [Candidatus Sumerlaeia bacterium]
MHDKNAPQLLLINPWIADVAAFDLWAWPLGLLYGASILRNWGCRVHLIDCTDRAHPALGDIGPRPRKYHTGKYYFEKWPEQPVPAQKAGRIFKRFGIPSEVFEDELDNVEADWTRPPDAVLLTSRMTYWYPGVRDAIRRVRLRWKNVPVILGGIYATLCTDHARESSGADMVLPGYGWDKLGEWLQQNTLSLKHSEIRSHPEDWPKPAFDLCHSREALPIASSMGCPCHCHYCASRLLQPQYLRRSAENVFQEIEDYHRRWQTVDFAFYDDALLMESEDFFLPLLERIVKAGLAIRLHTPNGMHYDQISSRLAEAMRPAGMTTLRLSLESVEASQLRRWNRDGNVKKFIKAVASLRQAGYERKDIGVYIMAGMPCQSVDSVRASIDIAHEAGATPKLNEYSPIPGTMEWDRALAVSGSEIAEEPLWQNNSFYYTRPEAFPREAFESLKKYAQGRAA